MWPRIDAGILEIGNERIFVRLEEIEKNLHEDTKLVLRTRSDVFDTNALLRNTKLHLDAKNYLNGLYGGSMVKTEIKEVIFNPPRTIVNWWDGTKTIVKCQDGDTYSKEQGLAMCIAKKYFGNKGNFNEVFKKFIGDEYTHDEDTMRKKLRSYCSGRNCTDCPLDKVTRFVPDCYTNVSYEKLKEHYDIVFGK